jgi:CDP-glucose 4,6-dehydratase
MTGFPDRRDSSRTSKPAAPLAEFLRDEFAGLSVLITGHTGFKGSWLTLWLRELGANVTGFALDPPTVPNNYEASAVADALGADYRADLRDRAALDRAIRASRPDVILHLAAQSVVLEGFAEPAETFSVNVLGTAVLLDALRATAQPCAVVVVTSDKCYANDETGRSFEEDDPLGGHDPYSASKAGTELVAQAYRDSFFPPSHVDDHGVAIATARAGNVIGGGDWTAHGVVADIVRSVVAGQPVRLRNPSAIRPWQHVLEPLSGYLTLAARLRGPDRAAFCRAWNFGPDSTDEATVRQLTELVLAAWGAGSWEDGSQPDDPPEAAVLRLSTRRASDELGWHPRWRLSDAVQHTVRWYQRFADKPSSAHATCLDDIDAYVLAGARRGESGDS